MPQIRYDAMCKEDAHTIKNSVEAKGCDFEPMEEYSYQEYLSDLEASKHNDNKSNNKGRIIATHWG